VIQKFSDAPVEVCPKCGGAVKKLLSSPAIQFKGTGWYITDYARAGKTDAGAGPSSSPSETASDSKPDAKPETKPDAKTETKSEAKSETKSGESKGTP
jgi:predicted nucleic acid-binding Zn ribbon protein